MTSLSSFIILIALAFLRLNIVASETPQHLSSENTSAASQTLDTPLLGSSNIPSDFGVPIQWGEKNLNILHFYQNALVAIATETQYDFIASSEGCHSGTHDFVIAKSDSAYPHLQHNHVVWTIQRVVEQVYTTRQYKELKGQIKVTTQDIRGREKVTIVGTITVTALGATTNDEQEVDLVSDNSSEGIDIKGQDLSDFDAPAMRAQVIPLAFNQTGTANRLGFDNATNPKNDDAMYVQPFFPDQPVPLPLHKVNVFLALIRALARIAEKPTGDLVSRFSYPDAEAGVLVLFKAEKEREVLTKWSDLASSLPYIVNAMRETNKWQECGGDFYKEVPGPDGRIDIVVYGRVFLVKMVQPSLPLKVE